MTGPFVNPLTSYAQAESLEAQAEIAARIAERDAEQRRAAEERRAEAPASTGRGRPDKT